MSTYSTATRSPFDAIVTTADLRSIPVPSADSMKIITRLYANMPMVLPGTTIGAFAVNDICNRMLAEGAVPRYLTMTFTVATEVSAAKQRYVAASIAEAAVMAEVEVVSVDTCYVAKPESGEMSVTVTAVGEMVPGNISTPKCLKAGDVMLLSGCVGAHGLAAMQGKEHFTYIPPVLSDSRSLGELVATLRNVLAKDVRLMYYPADGVLAAIDAIERESGLIFDLDRKAPGVSRAVALAAKRAERSPLDIATAGAMLVVVSGADAQRCLDAMRRCPNGTHAAIIGRFI